MKEATYRIIRFPKLNRFVAIAWNYDQAVLLSSADWSTYAQAKMELEHQAKRHDVNIKYFDGTYDAEDGLLIPRLFQEIVA